MLVHPVLRSGFTEIIETWFVTSLANEALS